MTKIVEILKAFKCAVCKEKTDIHKLELFAEYNLEKKKSEFYVHCEECDTSQDIKIHKEIKLQDYLLQPVVGAG